MPIKKTLFPISVISFEEHLLIQMNTIASRRQKMKPLPTPLILIEFYIAQFAVK